MIVAGRRSDILWGDGNWIFLDVGFSRKQRTCGLLFGNEDPLELSFGEAKSALVERIRNCNGSVNLVIEAPLSVCFNKIGNPTGRRIEKFNGMTRYWYVGLGCVVMTAALYIVREILAGDFEPKLRLFEGFVSFKDRGGKSDHLKDVKELREIVRRPRDFQDSIYSEDELKLDISDTLQGAFKVSGLDCGIPVVIMAR